jgi:metal-responsive CopG/Arc/MetJ family transcriptional regulator
MKTITLKISEELREQLDDEADEQGYSSRSEYLRQVIRRRHEADRVRQDYEERVEELEKEVTRAEARTDELRRQLQAQNTTTENTGDLVEKEKRDRRDGLMARVWRLIFGGNL